MAFVLKNTQQLKLIKPPYDPPVVVNVEETSDYENNFDQLLSLECYCNLDIVEFLKNLTIMSKDKKIRKIDIHLAPKDIEFYKKRASTSVTRKILINDNKLKSALLNQSRNNNPASVASSYQNTSRLNIPASAYSNTSTTIGTSLTPQQILQAVTNASSHRLERATDIFQGTLKVGSFDLTEVDINSIASKKKINFRSIDSSLATSVRNDIQEEQNINSDSFSSIYKKMIMGGKDPASLFKDHYLKTSQKKEMSGQITKNKKRKTEEQHIFEPIFHSFLNQIRSLSDKTIEFEQYYEQEIVRKLQTTVNVSHNKLKSISEGNNIVHVLLIARSNNDKKISSFSFPFDISEIDDQINQTSRRYDLATTRLNDNTSVLSIGNNNTKKELSVNVYGKRVSSLIPFEYAYYKSFPGSVVLPGNKVIYKDGGINKTKYGSNKNFNAYDNAYYRTTFNLKNKQYFNADSISDTRRKTTDNTPHLIVACRVNNRNNEEFISVNVGNISSNVKAIRVLKKKFKGDTQHISNSNDYEYIVDSAGEVQKNFQIVDSKNLDFVDYNVYRTSIYKYCVECIMNNGERKIAPNFMIERFEERSNIVEIKNIQLIQDVDDQETIEATSLNNFYDMNELLKSVVINFDVVQNQPESEKLLKTLFGDLFDLYKDQLQEIREGIQPLVCSVEITRQNLLTGENTTIGTIQPNEQGKCSFIDETCPIFADVVYKFKPRAIPAGDLISVIDEQIPLYAKKDIFRSGRMVAGSQIKAITNAQNKVISTVGRKYSKRNTFLKGLIESGQATIARQGGSDVFQGSSTGDIEYKNLTGADVFQREKNAITVSNSSVTEVREINSERDKRLKFKNRGAQIQRSFEDIQGYRKDGRLYPGSQGQIIRDLPETKLINFKLCDVTFNLIGNDFFVDFYAILVKENDFIYLDGIMHSTDDITNGKSYSYLFEHEGSFGLIEYYMVPIYKDGFLGVPLLIGANEIT